MAGPAILKVDIIADAGKANAAFSKVGNSAVKLGGTLKGLAVAAAGAFAVKQVADFGVASVKAAEESATATKRLNQVFVQAGDTTGKAAKAASDYAAALSLKTGIDDEAIMSSQALLVTFHAVSNETARSAGIFDRATTAAADMAAAGFGTLETNSVQLGKALQDPIKGVTALAKSGVGFSEAQKKQIKTLVEHNDLLGAQKIVLGEVERQIGGTAAATATATSKMKVAFGEMQEQVGAGMLPAINAILPQLQTLLPQIGATLGPVFSSLIGSLVTAFQALLPAIQPIVQTLGAVLAAVVSALAPAIAMLVPYIQQFALIMGNALFDAINAIAPVLPQIAAVLGQLAVAFASVAGPLIGALVPALVEILQAVVPLIPPITALAASLIRKMMPAVKPLIPLIVKLAKELAGELADGLKQLLPAAVPIVRVLAALLIALVPLIDALLPFTNLLVPLAAAWWVLNAAMSANPAVLITLAILALVAAVMWAYQNIRIFKTVVDTTGKVAVVAFNAIKVAALKVFDWIKRFWPLLFVILTGPFGLAVVAVVKNFDKIKAAVAAVFNWIKANWPLLLAILTGPIGIAVGIIIRNWDKVKAAATALYDWVRGKLQAIVDFFSGVAGSIGGFASDIADAIKGPINAVIRAWNGLEFTIGAFDPPGPGPKFGGATIGTPHIDELARGGTVLRSGLARVHEGEVFSGVGKTFGGQTTINVTVNTTGLGADAPQIQRAVVNALRGYAARNGPLDVPVRGAA